jgi:hypothetical protein
MGVIEWRLVVSAYIRSFVMNDPIWALAGVLVGACATGFINFFLQSKQFIHNKEMFSLQNRSSETVKILLTDMLNHRSYIDRSFDALKSPIGGYSDDEIRQFLHEIGAKKVSRDDAEWWYLLSRQDERIAKK